MRKYLIIILIAGICSLADAAWESIGPEGGYIRSIVVSATDGDLVYGATYYSPSKIVKSTDAGDSWTQVGSYSSTNYWIISFMLEHITVFIDQQMAGLPGSPAVVLLMFIYTVLLSIQPTRPRYMVRAENM
jgi:hypothetical protein